MNRAAHIYELLKDGREHCTHDIWREMGTAPMRARHELAKQGIQIETIRMCRHNGANYAVYRLISSPSIKIEKESANKLSQSQSEQNQLFEIKGSL